MRRMVIWSVAAAWVCGVALAGEAKKPGAPATKKAKLEAQVVKDDPEVAKIKQALEEKKVSFDFVETPVADTLAFLQQLVGVNIVVDPDVDRGRPVTLRVNNMKMSSALHWVAKLVRAKVEFRDGAIYFAPMHEGKGFAPKLHAFPRAHPGEPIGKAHLRLGEFGTIELDLFEEDFTPELRRMLLMLLHRQLAGAVREAQAEAMEEDEEAQERARRRQAEAEERAEAVRRAARARVEEARRDKERKIREMLERRKREAEEEEKEKPRNKGEL